MAKPSLHLIQILRNTAHQLEKSNCYQWGHMGSCNCGFLAQEITHLTKSEIHSAAMQGHGDWNEQLNDYCPSSGLPMDQVIGALLSIGLSIDDLKHLERLSDPVVLHRVPVAYRVLRHNAKRDVILYLNFWADVLEEKLIDTISLNDLANQGNRNKIHSFG